MRANDNPSKLSLDLFYIQMKWSLWYIPITFIIYLIIVQFVPEVEEMGLSFISFFYEPSKIYMLVIGIISCFAFLGYFVRNGLTRKDYFIGSAIAATGVAFSLMMISAILTGILLWIGTFTAYSPLNGHVAFLDTNSFWIAPVVSLSLIILCYYIGGWIIAVGFYRFGGWGGFGFILIAIFYMSIADLLWTGEITHPLANYLNMSMPNMSLGASIFGTLILIGIGLLLIRKVTKRVTIKLE
ncbi:hypothetical protein RYX56_18905 [Alkalihalophilus lindianensis]|uniref:ABC-2 type transport system permease protein n=1 Tax=Alkalihalophilus lindianensis TaxID=1630542 RepID=A0ABU3XEX2_9BACI|nr:hypothetical protein [Alkalihalophilus lindianensis]MDV2686442.1 hypothetical protein [Alkalihalophilus lindianensis]